LRDAAGTATALDKAVAIEQRMDGTVGRNFDPRKSADQTLANLSCTPGGVFALYVSGCSSPLGTATCAHSDGDAGFYQ
jgi:hypothetical protein